MVEVGIEKEAIEKVKDKKVIRGGGPRGGRDLGPTKKRRTQRRRTSSLRSSRQFGSGRGFGIFSESQGPLFVFVHRLPLLGSVLLSALAPSIEEWNVEAVERG